MHAKLGDNKFKLKGAEAEACNGVDVGATELEGGADAVDVGDAEADVCDGVDAVDA